jgi:hypothetical protein
VFAQDEALIRATWDMAAAEAPAIEVEFIRRVCGLAPHLCELLRGIAATEFDVLTRTFVGEVVATLNEPRRLIRFLRDFASTPAAIQLSEDDCVLLGLCFIGAVDTVLGARLDRAARAACLEAVTLLAALIGRVASQTRGACVN